MKALTSTNIVNSNRNSIKGYVIRVTTHVGYCIILSISVKDWNLHLFSLSVQFDNIT